MKKRIIKDYNNLPEQIREDIRHRHPHGYLNHLITFFDKDKNLVSALPHETEEVSYLIKMPSAMHIGDDDEVRDEGIKEVSKEESLEGLDEDKFLIQEEEEEESD